MIDVAIDAAKQAGELALKYFKNLPKVEYKADSTPVTRADREAELLIRKIISKKFPDHGIIGEEFEAKNPSAPLKWVIDPIDGTKSFIRKLPLWSTLLAVLENGKPVIAVAYYPYVNEIFAARKSKGTYLNDKKTKVSKIKSLNQATLNHNSIKRIESHLPLNKFMQLYRQTEVQRNLSSYAYNQILKGNIEIDLIGSGEIYDFAAPALLVEEAGGRFSDFSGKHSITSGNFIATNGLLHNNVLKILKRS